MTLHKWPEVGAGGTVGRYVQNLRKVDMSLKLNETSINHDRETWSHTEPYGSKERLLLQSVSSTFGNWWLAK